MLSYGSAFVIFPVAILCLPFLFDCKFSEEGIAIVVFFGMIQFDFIPIEHIKNAEVINLFSASKHFVMRLGNRVKFKVVSIETDNTKPRFWVLTLQNPYKAVALLSLSIRE